MQELIQDLKRIFSLNRNEITVTRILKGIWSRIVFVPSIISYYSPFRNQKKIREKLILLNNIHKGKRCFIIASGPSLKYIDFKLLKNEITFAMNRAYLFKEQLNFVPTYLVSIDKDTQLLQFTEDYDKINYTTTIYNWDLRKIFKNIKNRYFVKTKLSPNFASMFPELLGNGRSVTYTCIQIAYIMGFEEIYLIGKDHNYLTKALPNKKIKSSGNDGNHFLKNYYHKGQVYDAPDYISEEFAYKIARSKIENSGRIINDATIGGKLAIFEKIDFNSLF